VAVTTVKAPESPNVEQTITGTASVISLGSLFVLSFGPNVRIDEDFYEIDVVDTRGVFLVSISVDRQIHGNLENLDVAFRNFYLEPRTPAWNFRWVRPALFRFEMFVTVAGTVYRLEPSVLTERQTRRRASTGQYVYRLAIKDTPDRRALWAALSGASGLRNTYPIRLYFTDKPLTDPIFDTATAGDPVARAALLPGRMAAAALAGSPAAGATLVHGPVRARASAGQPSAYARRRAPAVPGVTATAGSPAVLFDLFPGKRFRVIAAAGLPSARAVLVQGNVAVSALSGSPSARAQLLPGNMSASARAGRRVRARASLPRPLNIPQARAAAGVPTARAFIQTPRTIPAVIASTGVPTADLILLPGRMAASASTDTPISRIRLKQLNLPKFTASTGEPEAIADILPSIRSSQFRYIPDYFVFRGREITPIDLPRVVNEVEGGRYSVTGLPDGLSYDPLAHRISGTMTDPRERIAITVSYAEPVDG